MYNDNQDFQNARVALNGIIGVAIVNSQQGLFVFSKYGVTWDFEEVIYADGAHLANGFYFAGGKRLLANEARVSSFEPVRETLSPQSADLQAFFTRSAMTEYTLTLSNTDLWCTSQLRADPFLGAELEIRYGFANVPLEQFQIVFFGNIRAERLTLDALTLKAVSK